MQKPSVGRIVHYVSYGTPGGEYTSECRAAVVTEVLDDDEVGLAVLNPTGMFFNSPIRHDEPRVIQVEGKSLRVPPNPAGGTWHWPERIEGAS